MAALRNRWVDILGAAATIAATQVGGGGSMAPLELAIRETGWLLTPCLFVVGASWTLYASWALLKASAYCGETTYEGIARRTVGSVGAVVLQAIIIMNALLICISLQSLSYDLLPIYSVNRLLVLVATGVLVHPFTALIRRLDRLAYLSAATAGAAIMWAGFIYARYALASTHLAAATTIEGAGALFEVQPASAPATDVHPPTRGPLPPVLTANLNPLLPCGWHDCSMSAPHTNGTWHTHSTHTAHTAHRAHSTHSTHSTLMLRGTHTPLEVPKLSSRGTCRGWPSLLASRSQSALLCSNLALLQRTLLPRSLTLPFEPSSRAVP